MADTPTETPLNDQVLAAIEKANATLREGGAEDGRSLIRLQIAHSLSLALADAVAQTRRLQTLAIAGQAAAQKRLMDGADPDLAREAAGLGHQAVEDSTRDALELARAALELFEGSAPASTDTSQ